MPRSVKPASQTVPSLLERVCDLNQIARGGLADRFDATAAERTAIATALGLLSLASLSFSFDLKPLSRRRFRLAGQLEGQATQSCVVTLEPVEAQITEAIELELWPADQIAPSGTMAPGAEVEVSLDGPEPYTGAVIDLGQIAYEAFASALEPYPRKPGAEFTGAESADAGQQAKESPFAALKALKTS